MAAFLPLKITGLAERLRLFLRTFSDLFFFSLDTIGHLVVLIQIQSSIKFHAKIMNAIFVRPALATTPATMFVFAFGV